MKEVETSSNPDWRLVRLARWSAKMARGEMDDDEGETQEWTPVEMPPEATSTANAAKGVATTINPEAMKNTETANIKAAGSASPGKKSQAELDLLAENQDLKNRVEQMEKMMAELMTEKRSRR